MKRWREQLLADTDDSSQSDGENHQLQEIFLDLIRIAPGTRGGSAPGKRPNLPRNRGAGHDRIMRDYFGLNSTFDDSMFRRRFRMRSQRIVTEAHIAECINDKKANTF